MSDDDVIRTRLEAVKDEIDMAISLLRQSHGEEHAEVMEGRIYSLLADLVSALYPTQWMVEEETLH